jgi:CSLREA domain-containing protein
LEVSYMRSARPISLLVLLLSSLLLLADVASPTNAATTFVVNSTADSGGTCLGEPDQCTLRQAIILANAMPDADEIHFDISGVGVHTIHPVSPMTPITNPVVIDGYTQSGASENTLPNGNDAVILIEIDGDLILGGGDGLKTSSDNVTIRGLAINNFQRNEQTDLGGSAIVVRGAADNVIEGNFLGTDAFGEAARPNELSGVRLEGADGTLIGGTAPAARNVISGNSAFGIQSISLVDAQTVPSQNTRIEGNFIGTDADGVSPLGNGDAGVYLLDSSTTTIGGTASGAKNVISGNGDGIRAEGLLCTLPDSCQPTDHVVQGNYIGTNVAGTQLVPNGSDGVAFVSGAIGNMIGGSTVAARNVITGNVNSNVSILEEASHGNFVQGNYIGVNAAGTQALAGAGNGNGIVIDNSVENLIGGTMAGQGNVISGHNGNGVLVSGLTAQANSIEGNLIGVLPGGDEAGNDLAGVRFEDGANGSTVGGAAAAAFNEIAYNGEEGVLHVLGAGANNPTSNLVWGNSIHDNGELGIDISLAANAGDGPTPNDTPAALDGDSGPNGVSNFPVLEAAIVGGGVSVDGVLDAKESHEYRIELFSNTACDPSDFGEGETSRDVLIVTTNAQGHAEFAATLPAGATFITALATDSQGNTSEYSECVTPTGGTTPTPTPSPTGGTSVTPTPPGGSVTPTPTGGSVTPTPTGGSATPTPTGGAAIQGDADCDGDVDVRDALAVFVAKALGTAVPCPERANVNCTGGVDEADGLMILAYLAGVYEAPASCTPIGQPLLT